MPRFVEQEVRQLASEPSGSDNVTLLIGYSGDSSVVCEFIEDIGGEVLEELPFSTLTAAIPETAVQQVIDHPETETVEMDSGMETLQGN